MPTPVRKRSLALSKVYSLLEPGPVLLLSTAHKGHANVMTMSWHTMLEFDPPLINECFASLESRVVDTRMKNRYNFFVLEVVKAWMAPGNAAPRTLHHRGYGLFMVAGETLKLPSRMP